MATSYTSGELKAQEAAYLCAVRGMTQEAVGHHLGISQSRVSRLLKLAESRQWLVRTYKFAEDALPPERVAELRRLGEPKTLLQLLAGVESDNGVRVRMVRVVGSPSKTTTQPAIRRRLNQFGREAAGILVEILPPSALFGVTWGTTISHVVDGIGETAMPRTSRVSVRFMPVCCEPLSQASNQDTSSNLAKRLHRLVGTTAELPPSLTGVPALISRRFQGTDRRGILKFFQDAASYREVFGPCRPRPLIDVVDSLLTSVGPAARPMGFIHDELLRAASAGGNKLTTAMLTRLVAGDIGGVLIPRRNLPAAERREVAALNGMWTGITRAHLERIATDADAKGRPGVVVACMGGSDRAEIVAEAVRCGLINVLIIDAELANALRIVLAADTKTT
jgi:DNA-binding transcriptional regulator LsrR (DeoR family)